MARRGDNIRKRKDGRWEGRYKKGREMNGSIVYGSVYGKSYFEVKEKLTDINNNVNIYVCNKSTLTFGDILIQWLSSNKIRLKGGTINKYQNIIDTHLMPDLGLVKIVRITSSMINSFLSKKLMDGRIDGSGALSPSYVRSMMIVINSAIKYAVSEGLCEPFKTPINKPSLEQKEIPVLTIIEQKRLEDIIYADFDEFKAGVLLSLYTGLRIGELCALSWNDVDMINKVIHVRHTIARVKNENETDAYKTKLIIDKPKTKASTRDIPISSLLFDLLKRLKNGYDSNFVISKDSSFVNPRTFEYHYQQLLKQNNIPYINFHCIRHTFATRCIEAGVDIKSLSEILGHANVNITLNTYVHSSIELKRSQLEKLCLLSA